ncbi:MAG: hypothetical protein LQ342_001358 [Letrouitia transgressa]|nr:MAG: hypothetical protein LQ342_001358 [Letrouitia transgressa]
MASPSTKALWVILSLQCIFAIVSTQDTTGLKASTFKGCFSSSKPLEDQGSWTYQSPGYCQTLCVGINKPVMGTTEGSNCWCGDFIPAASSKVADSKCSTDCQGYPDDKCGGPGTWSVSLTGTDNSVGNIQDSDSSSGSGSGTDSDSNSGSSPNAGSGSKLDSGSDPKAAADPAIPSSTSTPAAKSKPSPVAAAQNDPDPTKHDPPSTITRASTIVVTAPGQTKAVPSPAAPEKKAKGPNTAGIAAGVVVGIAAVGAVAGGLFFFLRNRKRRAVEAGYHRNSASSIIGETRPPPSSHSMSDSRLEPSVMMQRRQSDGSIADNQDYSRRILKVCDLSN